MITFSNHRMFLRLFFFCFFAILCILPFVSEKKIAENFAFSQQSTQSLPLEQHGETDALYREMLSSIESAISISANIRLNLRLFDQDFSASGTYHELKTPELRQENATRFRLDIQIQTPVETAEADDNNTLTIVCDNTYKYIYRFMSIEGQKKLELIDIKRLTEAIEKDGRQALPTEVGSMFGLGGLAGMLRSLRKQYDFLTPPMRSQINEKNGTVDVWKIQGRLKPEILSSLTVDAEGNHRSLPPQLPLAIDIYIGVEDRFPFRFDYFQPMKGTNEVGERFGYLLFYNRVMQDHGVSEANFDYQPSDNILSTDITDAVINRMLKK